MLIFVRSLLRYCDHRRASRIAAEVNPALEYALDRINSLVKIFGPIITAIDRNDMVKARELAPLLENVSDDVISGLDPILNDTLDRVNGGIGWLVRHAERTYVAQVISERYLGGLEQKAQRYNKNRQREMLALFCWVKIVMAREAEALPAWEGVRIVQEVVSDKF